MAEADDERWSAIRVAYQLSSDNRRLIREFCSTAEPEVDDGHLSSLVGNHHCAGIESCRQHLIMTPKKIQNLRDKIAKRSLELAILPDHDDTGHWYKWGDERYSSVTTKLQVIKDAGLMNWKMNRALEAVQKGIDDLMEFENVNACLPEIIRQAKQAPTLEFEGAGDIGSTVHNWREDWFRLWINNSVPGQYRASVADPRPEVISACRGIVNAIEELKAVPLACELALADRKIKVGGMLDDLWAVGDEVWLIDLKTSRIGNKNSYYLQVAAYWHMFLQLYRIKVDRLFILHVSKTHFGEYNMIELKHPKRYWSMAKSAFQLSDDLAELEELKKPEVVRI